MGIGALVGGAGVGLFATGRADMDCASHNGEGIRQRQGRTGDRGPSRSGPSAALYWIWVVGILSHASWVMATNEGTSMIPIVSQVNTA